jgi:uncharacterized protein YneF (UPF0154 family)
MKVTIICMLIIIAYFLGIIFGYFIRKCQDTTKVKSRNNREEEE